MSYQLFYTHQAKKDWLILKRDPYLVSEAKKILVFLEINPLVNPPPFKKLNGELRGAISRRLNRQHRLVYEIIEADKNVKIISMWSHYRK